MKATITTDGYGRSPQIVLEPESDIEKAILSEIQSERRCIEFNSVHFETDNNLETTEAKLKFNIHLKEK